MSIKHKKNHLKQDACTFSSFRFKPNTVFQYMNVYLPTNTGNENFNLRAN